METGGDFGFMLDFLARNTSPFYVAGVLASFLAVGVTTFLTWNLKSTLPATGESSSRMNEGIDECEEEERSPVTEDPGDDDDENRVRRRVVTPVKTSEEMTEDERLEERRVIQRQLKEIHALMKSEEEKFGGISMAEMQEQLRIYRT